MAKRKRVSNPAPRWSPRAGPDVSGAGSGRRRAYWLYGVHAALAALANPRRRVRRIILTEEVARRHGEAIAAALARRDDAPEIEKPNRKAISALLPEAAAHQGIAVLGEPLAPISLGAVCEAAGSRANHTVVVVLDQVSDPRNVGAVMRSAAAFGASALIVQDRHGPEETGALAKAAAGALEHLPMVRVPNLARALDALKNAGFFCIGLASRAERSLAETALTGRIAIVLGSEGAGLRRLTAVRCDALARVPTVGLIEQLNVSNAAAIALYEVARQRGAT